jgi:hypothetical protein
MSNLRDPGGVGRRFHPQAAPEIGRSMPKTKSGSSRIRRIAIAGRFLDDVQTRLHSEAGSQSVSYLSVSAWASHLVVFLPLRHFLRFKTSHFPTRDNRGAA